MAQNQVMLLVADSATDPLSDLGFQGTGLSLQLLELGSGSGHLMDSFSGDLASQGRLLVRGAGFSGLLSLSQASWQLEQHGETDDGQDSDSVAGLAQQLAKITKLRALLDFLPVHMCWQEGRLLDDEEKTRCRLQLVWLQGEGRRVGLIITEALRGYTQDHQSLLAALEAAGAEEVTSVDIILAGLGWRQGFYQVKPELQLGAADSARKSATLLIRTFFKLARANEAGIIGDLDTEFLHDYRVSLRKVRSVLSLFKGVYSDKATADLKQAFSDIMRRTNRLRDLDVYLLNREQYIDLVPPLSRPGVPLLFEDLQESRGQEFERVARYLGSKAYLREMARLEKQFSSAARISKGPKAGRKTLDLSSELIYRRFKRICKAARKIDDKTPDVEIHGVRIECKKLRYLLEFFTSLYPVDEIRGLIKKLKKLQDNLGAFNDYSVQQQFLQDVLALQAQRGRRGITLADSIGALTAMLYQKQLGERALVTENLAAFTGPETRALFTQLFQSVEREDEDNRLLQQ